MRELKVHAEAADVSMFHEANAELKLWCVANEQTTDSELKTVLDWACGKGGHMVAKLSITSLVIF
ncbi:carbohydrate-binding X8 domain protein [Medicago truncatula]|uniref:Carbohydrate-binding X8 domain protein n=1 Tax=Medicago truncatula TaxID=3880 RepID=G7KCN4_MEDTR|nr:carbohydrate-binding X8 domain protein [Medicago truncatula]